MCHLDHHTSFHFSLYNLHLPPSFSKRVSALHVSRTAQNLIVLPPDSFVVIITPGAAAAASSPVCSWLSNAWLRLSSLQSSEKPIIAIEQHSSWFINAHHVNTVWWKNWIYIYRRARWKMLDYGGCLFKCAVPKPIEMHDCVYTFVRWWRRQM